MPVGVQSHVLRLHVRKASAGGTYDDLEIGPVSFGEEWLIKRIASSDVTTAITKRGYAVRSGEALYWLHEEAIATAALRHGVDLEVVLVAGEYLVVRLTGCTLADVLHAWAVGEYLEVGEQA